MAANRGTILPKIADLASLQGGFFLAAQASAIGIDRFRLARLETSGFLERDSRGIYHLTGYPLGEDSELWAALLWAGLGNGKLKAVLSDDTALGLFDVSTVDPVGVDLTIPKDARLRRTHVPKRYRIRARRYTPKEITKVRGLPTTTVARTLLDLILDQRLFQFVDEALERAPARGLLTSRELATLQSLRNGDAGLIEAVRRR